MKCPHCGEDEDRVVDSRTSADGSVIRRRRECLKCYMRFTTYERIEETPLRVIKKSGERVRFERDRILAGMLRACEKLPVPLHAIEEAAARRNGHHMFDLPGYLLRRLRLLGVAAAEPSGHDTLSNQADFFSYRYNTLNGETDYGRGLSAIVLSERAS